ncbi:MAG TPA: S8 family serine peptidase [Candidatus Polarisedimenticolia bacterium]|nr:S8 family serine peptidase [Candidatus Polarisedimenticolia bacterium]
MIEHREPRRSLLSSSQFLVLFSCLGVLTLALGGDLPMASPADAAAVASPVRPFARADNVAPDRYIVVLRDEALQGKPGEPRLTSEGLGEKMSREVGGQIHRSFERVLKGFSATLDSHALEAMRKRPEVLLVEPVIRSEAAGTETVTSSVWGLDRIDQRNLPLDRTYHYPEGAAGVHAYVFDTGIYSSHSEFSGRVIEKKDFVGDLTGTEDLCTGHGTHVAGILGGETYGVAKDVMFHNMRVLDCGGHGTSEEHILAMDWVAEHHINPAVANMSIEYAVPSATVDTAVRNLAASGVTVVVAAGNYSQYACQFALADVSQIIVVGSVSKNDTQASDSNFGLCLDLYAPGVSILSAGNLGTSSTATKSGTSMAAPHVAGAAALYLAAHPAALPREVEAALVGHATSGKLTSLGPTSPNLLLMAQQGLARGSSLARGDFNLDGIDDLAIGVPGEDSGSVYDSGEVEIYLGSSSGFGSAPNQTWWQGANGLDGTPEAGDRFGSALAVGDFNGDHFDDLAIGAPGDSINGAREAGAVSILFGSSAGLSAAADQRWHQDSSGVQGVAELADRFGAALASGDFDHDGYADLAIGSPGDGINSGTYNAGAVTILYGSSGGLTSTGNQRWYQDGLGLSISSESGDLFGAVLATGDFNHDLRDDLLIGSPTEDIDDAIDAGMIVVLYGTSTGLLSTGAKVWHQDTTEGSIEVAMVAETGDFFGSSLAAGDFDGDGRDDAAIGVPGEDVVDTENAGIVSILYGSSSGLSASGNQAWNQGESSDLEGSLDADDRMGCSVAAGDFNHDGYSDLAVGSCGENNSDTGNAQGMISILYGGGSGLRSTGDQVFSQSSPGILDTAEAYDGMGVALVTGFFNGGSICDLAIGVPGEEASVDRSDSGVVNVLFGTTGGLSDAGNQLLD